MAFGLFLEEREFSMQPVQVITDGIRTKMKRFVIVLFELIRQEFSRRQRFLGQFEQEFHEGSHCFQLAFSCFETVFPGNGAQSKS